MDITEYERIKGNEQSELNERARRRLEIKKKFRQNERCKGTYDPKEGVYNVVIGQISIKENKNGNSYMQFVCHNLDKKEKLYASYYLTDGTDESTITELRCLLDEFNQDDFTDYEIVDDYAILERLQILIGEEAKLVVENQDGFMSAKLYREIPSE